jgi:hypothetical protein
VMLRNFASSWCWYFAMKAVMTSFETPHRSSAGWLFVLMAWRSFVDPRGTC